MSKMTLKTFASCVINDTTAPTLPLDLSHVLVTLKFPTNCLTMLYGHNNGATVASKAIDMAEADGFSCRSFELFINNSNWTIQSIGLEPGANAPALSEMNVLTLHRCKKDLRHIVFERWAVFIDQEVLSADERELLKAEDPIFAMSRPDFIGFLHEQTHFAHLDAITYRVNSGTEIISMASVFSFDCIDRNIQIGFGPTADTPTLPILMRATPSQLDDT